MDLGDEPRDDLDGEPTDEAEAGEGCARGLLGCLGSIVVGVITFVVVGCVLMLAWNAFNWADKDPMSQGILGGLVLYFVVLPVAAVVGLIAMFVIWGCTKS